MERSLGVLKKDPKKGWGREAKRPGVGRAVCKETCGSGGLGFRGPGLQRVEFGDEGFGAAGLVSEFTHLFAFGIQHDDGGMSADPVLVFEFGILGFELGALEFFSGKVHLHEHEVLLCVLFELGFGENLLVEFDAPAAPVRPGEVEEHHFLFGFCLREGFLVVVIPTACGKSGGREQGEHQGWEEAENVLHGNKMEARG